MGRGYESVITPLPPAPFVIHNRAVESDRRDGSDWLASVGAELRSRIGDEFRAEAEAEERAVAALRVRHRSLADVAVELMHRGDEVTASLGLSTVVGRVIHVASDLATLLTSRDAVLHVRLEAPLVLCRNPEPAPGRGRPRDPMGCDSFLALLRALSLALSPVRIETPGPVRATTGHITTVAVDHLVFSAADLEWFIPLEAVWGVWE